MALPIRKPNTQEPVRWIVLYGGRGVGKTTLSTLLAAGKTISFAMEKSDIIYGASPTASQWDVIDPADENGVERSPESVLRMIEAVCRGEGGYDTIVIESISALDALVTRSTIDRRVKGDELRSLMAVAGGYGKGMGEVENLHSRVEAALKVAKVRNMRIILIAHQKIVTIQQPDGGSYTQWGVASEGKSAERYLNEADAVLRLYSPITTDEKTHRARGGGDYVFIDGRHSPTSESKARIQGLARLHTWDDPTVNPLAQWIPSDTGGAAPGADVWSTKGGQQIAAKAREAYARNDGSFERVGPWAVGQGFSQDDVNALIERIKAEAQA